MKKIKLSQKDLLAMYRCAFYTAMGVTNDDKKPTDQQVIEWFQKVLTQALHRTDPPIVLIAHEPQHFSALATSNLHGFDVLKFDAVVKLPEWRN